MSDYQKKRLAAVSAEDRAAIEGYKSDWLNPIAMSKLKSAVERKEKTVVLNGTVFNITYGEQFKSRLGMESTECVKLKRADGGFAPFGYVSLKRLEKFEFDVEES